jgi:hypothetical protein
MPIVKADEFPPGKYMNEEKQRKLVLNTCIGLLQSFYGCLVFIEQERENAALYFMF